MSTLPPGFRFHPTDDELVGYYLKRKADGLTIELEVIPVIDLCKSDPWELPDKSFLPKRDMEWFFFCPRDKKYPNGSQTNRATASGYWKATGKDRKVFCEPSVQGLRKTLVFYRGRAPGGERTDWVMHEYRLCEDLCQPIPNFLGAFALCRVVKRNEQGLKNGDSMGECKGKRSFSSLVSDFSPRKNFSKALTSEEENSSQAKSHFEINNDSSPITVESGKRTEMQPIVVETDEMTGFWESRYLCNFPKDYSSVQSFLSEPLQQTQFPDSKGISPVSSYSSFTEETNYLADELNTRRNLSPFPSPLDDMNVYCNGQDTGLHWEMPQYMNTSFNGFELCNTMLYPSICSRQASDLEEASLWVHEDGLVWGCEPKGKKREKKKELILGY